jgi:hypothetical protein
MPVVQDLLCQIQANTTQRPDAGGIRLTHAFLRGHRIILHFTGPVHAGSLRPDAIQVALLGPGNWRPLEVTAIPAIEEHFSIVDRELSHVSADIAFDTGGEVEFSLRTQEIRLHVAIDQTDWSRLTIETDASHHLWREAVALRLVVRGSGPCPLIGEEDLIPFAGTRHQGPGSAQDGNDYVLLRKLRG